MAYDKTLPTSATKIRNYPTVLTANWAAIEEGDVTLKQQSINMVRRESVPVASNPTRLDDLVFIFSKGTAAESSETYIMDDQNPANVIQITEEGSLGSISTQVNTNGVAFDINATTGLTYVDGQLITAYGQFDSSGAFQFGKNMSTAGAPHPSLGTFNIDVDADILQNPSYIVTGTAMRATATTGTSLHGVEVKKVPAPVVATTTTIQIQTRGQHGLTDAIDNFYIMICGGR